MSEAAAVSVSEFNALTQEMVNVRLSLRQKEDEHETLQAEHAALRKQHAQLVKKLKKAEKTISKSSNKRAIREMEDEIERIRAEVRPFPRSSGCDCRCLLPSCGCDCRCLPSPFCGCDCLDIDLLRLPLPPPSPRIFILVESGIALTAAWHRLTNVS